MPRSEHLVERGTAEPTAPRDPLRTPFLPTAALVTTIVVYRLAVDLAYRTLVAAPFSYQGFQDAPSSGNMVLSWMFLLALLPLVLRVFRLETLSGHFATVLALISLVPTTTLIAHDPRYTLAYVLLMFTYWGIFLLAFAFLPSVSPFRFPLRSEVPHLAVVGILSASILFISWRFTGFRLHFGLFDIYEIRAEAREYGVGTLLGYLATMADNILPVLLAYYLRRRWLVVAAAVAVTLFFNFGISATKQVLFLLLFAIASVAVKEDSRLNPRILAGLTVLVVLAILERQVLDTLILGALVLHRILAMPAHLHWVHYDFFQDHSVLYLTQSALRFFFDSPYEENVQFLLGDFFIGDITARANNGLFSDAYMNFGAAGVLFQPLLVVFVVKLMEGAVKGLATNVRLMVTIAISIVFLGVPVPTAILSSGVGALVLLLATLPRLPNAAVHGIGHG